MLVSDCVAAGCMATQFPVWGQEPPLEESGPAVVVVVDLTAIRRVLENLISNAIRHAERTAVNVSLKQERNRGLLMIANAAPGLGGRTHVS